MLCLNVFVVLSCAVCPQLLCIKCSVARSLLLSQLATYVDDRIMLRRHRVTSHHLRFVALYSMHMYILWLQHTAAIHRVYQSQPRATDTRHIISLKVKPWEIQVAMAAPHLLMSSQRGRIYFPWLFDWV